MRESGSYSKLKKLAFELTNWGDDTYQCMLSDEDSPWESFVSSFGKLYELELTALSIQGRFLDEMNIEKAHTLYSAITLELLTTLELTFVGCSPHGMGYWDSDFHSTEFLVEISSCLRSLKTLSINFESEEEDNVAHDCLCISKLLRGKFKDRLTSFAVTFCPPTQRSLQPLQEAIINGQKNLKYLSINNGDFFSPHLDFLTKNSKQKREELFDYMMPAIIKCERKKPFHAPWYLNNVQKNLTKFSAMIEKDLVYQKAYEYLPQLTEYCRNEMRFNMKQLGVIVNGVTIPFAQRYESKYKQQKI